MTEYQQPAHPMRIATSTDKYWYFHIVYAVRVDERGLSYLTANGLTYTSQEIAFAETLISGEWLRMETRERLTASND